MSHNFKNVLNEHYSKPFIDGDIKYGCIFCGCNTNYEHKKSYDCGFAGEPVSSDDKQRIFKITSICTNSIDCDLGL